jgi:hypothetical protein
VQIFESGIATASFTAIVLKYAKDADDPEDISIRITAFNRGPDPANLHLIPQLTFGNTCSWPLNPPKRPEVWESSPGVITAEHSTLGRMHIHCLSSPFPVDAGKPTVCASDDDEIIPELLFTENDTNHERLHDGQNQHPYVKDAFHDHIIPSHRLSPTPELPTSLQPPVSFVNPNKTGTKSAAHYTFKNVPGSGGCVVVRLKMTRKTLEEDPTINDEEVFDAAVEARRNEADEFYETISHAVSTPDLHNISRQALGGMLWWALTIGICSTPCG